MRLTLISALCWLLFPFIVLAVISVIDRIQARPQSVIVIDPAP